MIKNAMIDNWTNDVEPQLMNNFCGIASLAYVLNTFFNKNTSEHNQRRKASPSLRIAVANHHVPGTYKEGGI